MSASCENFVILYNFETLNVHVTYTASNAIFVISVNGKTQYSIYRSKDTIGRKIWVSSESIGKPDLRVSMLGDLIDKYLKQRAKS